MTQSTAGSETLFFHEEPPIPLGRLADSGWTFFPITAITEPAIPPEQIML
jgi:hypothetical protein